MGAEYVAEQGPRVLVIDVREAAELASPLGCVPWSRHVPLERITDVLRLGRGARVVLVSSQGHRASAAARMLELAGMSCVAALEGGMAGWRAAGFPIRRDGRIDPTLPEDVDAPLLQPERP